VLKAGKGQVLCGNRAVVEDVARVLRYVEEPAAGKPRGPDALLLAIGVPVLATAAFLLLRK
jgi:hypothetical protein